MGSNPSVDGQSAYVAVYLLARAIQRADTSDIDEVRRAAVPYSPSTHPACCHLPTHGSAGTTG
jgi:hypothetical protein